MDCIFCKIVSGEIPSHKVYEDNWSLAFLDIAPSSYGHTLVIPKDHFENIYTLPDETLARLALSAKKVAVAVKNATLCDGVNLIMNNEKNAGQIIFHAHIHIIPRKENDGLKLFPHGSSANEELIILSGKIKEQIKD